MAQVMLIENMTKKQLALAYSCVLSDLHDEKKRNMETISEKDRQIAELKSVIEDLRDYNSKLIEQVMLLRSGKFGKQKWAGLLPGKNREQMSIFDCINEGKKYDDSALPARNQAEKPEGGPKAGKKKKRTKKKEIDYSALEVIPGDPAPVTEDMKKCPNCGAEMQLKGYYYTRELVAVPAQLYIKETKVPRFECVECQSLNEDGKSTVVTAPCRKLIRGSLLSPSLGAYLITQRHQAGLPYYAIEKMLKTYGADIPRANMENWMEKMADRLVPLYSMMTDDIRKFDIVMMDETRWQVLREKGKIPQSHSYIWVMRTPPGRKDIIIYLYSPTRNGDVARDLLKGWSGFLMTDGYSGYSKVEGARSLRCNVHALRKFRDALSLLPEGHDPDAPEAQAVSKYRAIIHEENELQREALGLFPEDEKGRLLHIAEGRKRIAAHMDDFFAWLEKIIMERQYGHTFEEAVGYALNAREALRGFTARGDLPSSNQLTEQAVRPIVTIRNRCQFNVSPEGAQTDMIMFSLMETCVQNGLNPYWYFTYILDRIIDLDPEKDTEAIRDLLPYSDTIADKVRKYRKRQESGTK